MISKLEIVNDAKDEASKYSFLVGKPYVISLDNNQQLEIQYSKTSQWLRYSIKDENGNNLLQNQPIRYYPWNLSLETDRVLYLTQLYYLIDLSKTEWEYTFGNSLLEEDDLFKIISTVNVKIYEEQ